jgi:hypothetical protein
MDFAILDPTGTPKSVTSFGCATCFQNLFAGTISCNCDLSKQKRNLKALCHHFLESHDYQKLIGKTLTRNSGVLTITPELLSTMFVTDYFGQQIRGRADECSGQVQLLFAQFLCSAAMGR